MTFCVTECMLRDGGNRLVYYFCGVCLYICMFVVYRLKVDVYEDMVVYICVYVCCVHTWDMCVCSVCMN